MKTRNSCAVFGVNAKEEEVKVTLMGITTAKYSGVFFAN
jgi:hypothetical protein